MSRYTLPYFANPVSLPASPPSPRQIESAGHLLSKSTGRKVVRVGEHFVVKYGVNADILKGENKFFVAQQTTLVPVPESLHCSSGLPVMANHPPNTSSWNTSMAIH